MVVLALAIFGTLPSAADSTRVLLPANALACGSPVLDVTDFDLVGVEQNGIRHPDLPADMRVLTFTWEQWVCIYPNELKKEDVGRPGLSLPPPHEHAAFAPGTDSDLAPPRTGSYGGYLKVVIVLPDPSNPYYPNSGCNWDDVGQAMIWLNQNVGGGSYQRWCYYTPAPGWGAINVLSMSLNALHDYVETSQVQWVDDPNEIVVGVQDYADHNGIAWNNDRLSILAEQSYDGWNLYDDSTVLHEVTHNFGGDHYPYGGNPYVCSGLGAGSSVMNYCNIATYHAHGYDSTTYNLVYPMYWATW